MYNIGEKFCIELVFTTRTGHVQRTRTFRFQHHQRWEKCWYSCYCWYTIEDEYTSRKYYPDVE